MKFTDALRGYQPISSELKREIWENGIFCYDTNVLLDLYRYSDDSQKQLFEMLRTTRERLFVPARVAEEFARNRPKVIHGQFAPHRFVRQKLKELHDGLEKEHKNHQQLTQVRDFVQKLQKLEKESFVAAEQEQDKLHDDDTILGKLIAIIQNAVGEPLPDDELQVDFNRRKEGDIPPFCKTDDKKDDEDSRLGDVAIWIELQNFCHNKGLPLVFITRDEKQNWWHQTGDREIPQPLLVREFFEKTGQEVLFYTPDRFFEDFSKHLNSRDTHQLIAESKELAERDRKRQLAKKMRHKHAQKQKSVESLRRMKHTRDHVKFLMGRLEHDFDIDVSAIALPDGGRSRGDIDLLERLYDAATQGPEEYSRQLYFFNQDMLSRHMQKSEDVRLLAARRKHEMEYGLESSGENKHRVERRRKRADGTFADGE